jgi:hypothetical protein
VTRLRAAGLSILAPPFRVASYLFLIAAGEAQAQQAGGQHQHAEPGSGGQTLCLTCPSARESSGTSWQPDATPGHRHEMTFGRWQLRTHGQIALVRVSERGPRGDRAAFAPNHLALGASTRAWGGVVGVQSMWSIEPMMGPRGYPLLTQVGETSDGITPLIDRQHPHDLPMELAVTYARPIGSDRAFYLYVAAAGAPALGPPPFMHRASAVRLPTAPVTHHWFDSTHITFGVVTAGLVTSPRVKLEASAFRGREPDEQRWGLEAPRLDSFAARLSINPAPSLAVQVSAGVLNDAEQIHPDADVGRLTASAMYARQWTRVGVDATLAWGRNSRTTSLIPVPGGFFEFPGAVSQAVLAEATVRLASRHAAVGRVERARKDELFQIDDPRHNFLYPVTRATAGYVLDVVRQRRLTAAAGVAASWTRVSSDIRAEYGGPPVSGMVFLELRAH